MNNIPIDQSGFGSAVLAMGILNMFMSCCGCGTCKFKNVVFALPFGLLSGVLGLAILIIGFLILGAVGPLTDKILKQVCSGSAGAQLAQEYNDAVSKFVCSKTCPCSF